jgi:hypothetical protein
VLLRCSPSVVASDRCGKARVAQPLIVAPLQLGVPQVLLVRKRALAYALEASEFRKLSQRKRRSYFGGHGVGAVGVHTSPRVDPGPVGIAVLRYATGGHP